MTTSVDDRIVELLERCEWHSKRFARAYPPCEAEDIAQDMALCLVENRDQLDGIFAAAEADSEADPAKIIDAMLKARATSYCRWWRAGVGIIHNAYFYTPNDVRVAIPSWFDYDGWPAYIQGKGPADGQRIYSARGGAVDPDGITADATNRTGQVIWHDDKSEGLAVLVDISRCYESLPAQYRAVLEAISWQGYTADDVAKREGVQAQSVTNRYSRAIDALTELMNGTR